VLDELKSKLCRATHDALAIVDFNKPFVIHVDASDYAVGNVLTQPDVYNRERTVAFLARNLIKPSSHGLQLKKKRLPLFGH